ncbi:hypothetical protein A1O1_07623 [Capronia coronata CBS 617.96]|uniref:Uncharacterized protein n=1 Tax=Capronia coronata CBS 617.96 TaxID=1182541 RepID=W9YH02_9EURO|nr:uncharacterized protein A1O1_07623 [Capronia coronata CBS 617.96]EXJ81559.1 hypothetical protein A1O1_07623 [Capronia coronata CBS 617.96]
MTPNLVKPTASKHDEEQLGLLTVAFELRLNLYDMLFRRSEPIKLVITPEGRFKALNVSSAQFPLQLLATCRKIYIEASPIVYQCNKYTMSWDIFPVPTLLQPGISDYLRSIEIDCISGDVWGYVQAVKSLTGNARGLQEVNFIFHGSGRFMAAAVEISNAIAACSPSFGVPVLQAVITPLARDDLGATTKYLPPLVEDIHKSLKKGRGKLQNIIEHGGPPDTQLITTTDAPKLRVIRLVGTVSRSLKSTFEMHRCSTGQCGFVMDREKVVQAAAVIGADLRRYYYTWKHIGGPAIEVDPNMLQWYPELPEKDKQTIKEFMLSLSMGIDHPTTNTDADGLATDGTDSEGGSKSSQLQQQRGTASGLTASNGGDDRLHGGMAHAAHLFSALAITNSVTDQPVSAFQPASTMGFAVHNAAAQTTAAADTQESTSNVNNNGNTQHTPEDYWEGVEAVDPDSTSEDEEPNNATQEAEALLRDGSPPNEDANDATQAEEASETRHNVPAGETLGAQLLQLPADPGPDRLQEWVTEMRDRVAKYVEKRADP